MAMSLVREANENAPAGLTGVPGETSPLSRLAVTLIVLALFGRRFCLLPTILSKRTADRIASVTDHFHPAERTGLSMPASVGSRFTVGRRLIECALVLAIMTDPLNVQPPA